MSPNAKNFRLAAYLGAGAIFLGLLAFIFLAFPDTDRMKVPSLGSDDSAGKKMSSGTRLPDHSTQKKISDPSEAGEGIDPNDPSIAGELIIRAGSLEELAKIYTRALPYGAQFEGVLKELNAVRLQFPSRAAAEKFRNSLKEGEMADSNYVVMAPDFPTDDELNGGTRTSDPGNRTGTTTSSDGLQPFGNRALEFLSITEDNSTWGGGLTIAILDSGVYAHESLTGINIRQIDLVQTPENPDADYTGHGTAVADIAHMVAPIADFLSIRVLDSEGIGDTFTVAQGIIAATDNGANIINLSLGSYGDSIVLRDAINYANSKGVAIVAASGNDGIAQVSYPAAYDSVIGVSSVDANGTFANFSNTGEGVDISAPGVGVYSAWGAEGEASFSGTSASTPFVSAAIAAFMTRNPGYTIGQAAEQVLQSARDTGAAGDDPQTGKGILNFGK